ncbi:hypothetical protein SUDANB121_02154 [Nocardiopsis dassonvillei]
MQCIAEKHAPPGVDRNTSALVRGRAGVRHLRPVELATVRRIAAGAAGFALDHTGGHGGDLLSPEFSAQPTRYFPTRPPRTNGVGPGRVVPLRPDLAGWTRPLTGGAPARLVPGRGRHHRPPAPTQLSLEGYAHPAPVKAPTKGSAQTRGGRRSPEPAREQAPRIRRGVRRCAFRVRAYVAHPGGDLAPLALAVRAYLGRGVR